MCYPSIYRCLFLLLLTTFYLGCSDDSKDPEKDVALPPTVEEKAAQVPQKPAPNVYIEELDQYQEYFKEQHETSFSHVKKKNWTSYTAGKDGILTKVLLFGKPNYTISEHYGSSMSGFVRADNPDSGPKLGEWSLTREEIINQLALQGLTETDRGWITLQMLGEIPQQAGRMYFIVCDNIGDKRAWFGAFAFAEGNSYKNGRFWLHPEHDLVFRTYVGKTSNQLEKEQRGEPLFDSGTASLVPTNDLPEAPKPMIELSQNFEPSPPPTEQGNGLLYDAPDEPLYQPATQAPKEEEILEPVITTPEVVETPLESAPTEESGQEPNQPVEKTEELENGAPKGSLFERFFNNKPE